MLDVGSEGIFDSAPESDRVPGEQGLHPLEEVCVGLVGVEVGHHVREAGSLGGQEVDRLLHLPTDSVFAHTDDEGDTPDDCK
jgi:hypothetical protein